MLTLNAFSKILSVYVGTSRTTIVLWPLHLAVKVPRVKVRTAWITLRLFLEQERLRSCLYREIFDSSVFSRYSIKTLLLRGVYENWTEFLFYQKTRNRFVQPTYFSFFGLFSIQPIGRPYRGGWESLWNMLVRATHGEVNLDGHHFENPQNFGEYHGRVRITDYGSPTARQVLAKYGNVIADMN